MADQTARSVAEQLGFTEAQLDALLEEIVHTKAGCHWPVNAAATQRRIDDAAWNEKVQL